MLHNRALRAVVLLSLALPAVARAQDHDPSRQETLWSRALAVHFSVSPDEVSLLSKRGSTADELAVVLFVAHRSGVTIDAVVAARRTASGWDGVSRRFGLGAGAFHLPLATTVPLRSLRAAYSRFESTPPSAWTEIRLSDEAIAALVNIRVISKSLRVPPDDVLRELRDGERFDQLFARLVEARTAGGHPR